MSARVWAEQWRLLAAAAALFNPATIGRVAELMAATQQEQVRLGQVPEPPTLRSLPDGTITATWTTGTWTVRGGVAEWNA